MEAAGGAAAVAGAARAKQRKLVDRKASKVRVATCEVTVQANGSAAGVRMYAGRYGMWTQCEGRFAGEGGEEPQIKPQFGPAPLEPLPVAAASSVRHGAHTPPLCSGCVLVFCGVCVLDTFHPSRTVSICQAMERCSVVKWRRPRS